MYGMAFIVFDAETTFRQAKKMKTGELHRLCSPGLCCSIHIDKTFCD